jgi:hypothetical protein
MVQKITHFRTFIFLMVLAVLVICSGTAQADWYTSNLKFVDEDMIACKDGDVQIQASIYSDGSAPCVWESYRLSVDWDFGISGDWEWIGECRSAVSEGCDFEKYDYVFPDIVDTSEYLPLDEGPSHNYRIRLELWTDNNCSGTKGTSVKNPATFNLTQCVDTLSCVYECKHEYNNPRRDRWGEITTLMITNSNSDRGCYGWGRDHIIFFDGNENAIARTGLDLSSNDVDEINVCETLREGISEENVPSAGYIQIRLGDSNEYNSQVTAFIKNMYGGFEKGIAEPFDEENRLAQGIGKTKCEFSTHPDEYDDEYCSEPWIDSILIEQTDEEGCYCDPCTSCKCAVECSD